MSKLQVCVIDPVAGSRHVETFADSSALWDAVEVAPLQNKTHHEYVGIDAVQKLHLRYISRSGQADPTPEVLKALKSILKSKWSIQLKDEEVILARFTSPKGTIYDLVVNNYSVHGSRQALVFSQMVQAKAGNIVFDESVFRPDAEVLLLGCHNPLEKIATKIEFNTTIGNQRHLRISSLITDTANTTRLNPGNKGSSDPQAVQMVPGLQLKETQEDHCESCDREQSKSARLERTGSSNVPLSSPRTGSAKTPHSARGSQPNSPREEGLSPRGKTIQKSKTGRAKTLLFGHAQKRNQETGHREELKEVNKK